MENITLGQIGQAIALITTISAIFFAVFKWYKNKSDKLDSLEQRIIVLEKDSKNNKQENLILLKGQLACLKGLKEQGCNGPVTQSINEIENYLLNKSHDIY